MKIHSYQLALLTSAMLVACGGSTSPSGPTPPSTNFQLIGNVSKGPVKGAKLTAYAVSANGNKESLGTTTTGAGGAYTLDIVKPNLPILLVADLDGADIADETKPGVTYKGTSSQMLQAIASVDATATKQTINITPFSDMAANMALETGRVSTENVAGANKKVREFLGNIDHLTLNPIDNADMVTKLTAVQTVVNKDGLSAVLDSARAAAVGGTDGTFRINGALSSTLTQACNAASTSGTCASPFATSALSEQPITGTAATPLEVTKGLFSDLRNTALAYSNAQDTGPLDVAGNGLEKAVRGMVLPLDVDTLDLTQQINQSVGMYRQYKKAIAAAPTYVSSNRWVKGKRFSTETTDGNFPLHQCSVVAMTASTNATGQTQVSNWITDPTKFTPTTANGFVCIGIATTGALVPGGGDGQRYWRRIYFVDQGDGINFKVLDQLRSMPYNTPTAASVVVQEKYAAITIERASDGSVNKFAFKGQLNPPALIITGQSLADKKLPTAGALGHTLYSHLDVDLSAQGGATNATMSGSLSVVDKAGKQATQMSITNMSLQVPQANQGLSGLEKAIKMDVGNVTVMSAGVKFEGVLGFDNAQPAANGARNTSASFVGKLFEGDGAGGYRQLFEGTITAKANNYLNQVSNAAMNSSYSVDATGKLSLKDRPDVTLVLNATQGSDGLVKGTGTFSWNGKSIAYQVQNAAANSRQVALSVSNSDGVRFAIPINGYATAQPVFKGDVKVGSIVWNQKRIDYIDGSYEQF